MGSGRGMPPNREPSSAGGTSLWSCQATSRPEPGTTRRIRHDAAPAVSDPDRRRTEDVRPAREGEPTRSDPGLGPARLVDRGSADPVSHERRGWGSAPAYSAGRRSFMAVPLSLRTLDGLPTPGPRTTGDAPKERHQIGRSNPVGRPPSGRVHPVRLRQQHPVNQLHQQPIMTLPDPVGRVSTGQPASVSVSMNFLARIGGKILTGMATPSHKVRCGGRSWRSAGGRHVSWSRGRRTSGTVEPDRRFRTLRLRPP